MKYCIMLAFLFVCSTSNAQQRSFSTIQEALKAHLDEFEQNYTNYDQIFIGTEIDDSTNLPEKVHQIRFAVNSEQLQKKQKNYLIRMVIHSHKESFKLDIINFRIVKHSKKRLQFINLGNGRSYSIDPFMVSSNSSKTSKLELTKPAVGAVIYNGGSTVPAVSLTVDALKKILK